MKRWAVATTIGGGIGALLMLAAQVSYDEAAENLASYEKLLAKMGQEPVSSILFWVGMGVLATTLLITTWKLFSRIDKRKGQTAPSTHSGDHWAQRKRLEISVLANLSANRDPNASPISDEPENSRLRELKDAIDLGELDAEINGDRPNVMSTVTLHDFTLYVAATNKFHWMDILQRWQVAHTPTVDELNHEMKAKRIPLLKFLEIAKKRGWDMLEPGGYEAFDLIHGISEAAGLGDLVLLGKKMDRQIPGFTYSGRRLTIPAETWQNHEIDPISCFIFTNPGNVAGFTDDNQKTQTKCDPGNNALSFQDYADLYIATEGLLDWLVNDADDYRGFFQKTYGE